MKFFRVLYFIFEVHSLDGADASRRAIGPWIEHPLSVRRCAPAIQWMQRTAVAASKLATPSAADPRPVSWMQKQIV